MKTLIGITAFLFVILSPEGRAAWVSVELDPSFNYQDVDTACSMDEWRPLFITGQVDGARVTALRIKNANMAYVYETDFLPEELQGVEVMPDAMGKYYIKTLPLSERLLSWIFFNIDNEGIAPQGFCRPPQALATVSPASFTYQFLVDDGTQFPTAEQDFSGEREDGTPYSIRLGFNETIQ